MWCGAACWGLSALQGLEKKEAGGAWGLGADLPVYLSAAAPVTSEFLTLLNLPPVFTHQ